MRKLLGVAFTVLAACETPHGNDGLSQKGGGGIDALGSSTAARVDLGRPIGEWVNSNITDICGVVTARGGDKDCARRVLLRAFDTSGAARSKCPSDTSIGQFAECVIFGSITRELLDRMGGGGESVFFDWQAPNASMHAAFETMVYSNTIDCFGQEPSTFQSCYRLQATRSLGLSEAYDTICGGKDTVEWDRCILEAFVSNELTEASLRI